MIPSALPNSPKRHLSLYNATMRENDFIAWITAQTPPTTAVHIGIGDDMAAIAAALPHSGGASGANASGPLILLKIDQALDQVHFDLAIHSPRQAGQKAVNRCLSDCAAMACLPRAILISVALPQAAADNFAKELFLGARDAAAVFNCPLVGGDTAIWNQRLAITIAAMGTADHQPIQRSGAKPGDTVCVSGRLGGSILGRHMTFTPRIAFAQKLVAAAPIHSMMDISDGLAMDFPRLMAASGCGGVVDSRRLPVHPDARKLATQDGQPAWRHALTDGEDYELLFTLAPADFPLLENLDPDVPVTAVGTVTESGPLQLALPDGTVVPWPAGGWEHISRTDGL